LSNETEINDLERKMLLYSNEHLKVKLFVNQLLKK